MRGVRALTAMLVCGLLGCASNGGGPDATVVRTDAVATTDTGRGDAGTDGMEDAGSTDGGMDAGADAGTGTAPEKGPWVLRVDTTRAVVRWETLAMPRVTAITLQSEAADAGTWTTATGSAVAQVVTAGYGLGVSFITQPDLTGTFYMNEVDVTGLAPATCYRYRVVDNEDVTGRFCTMHNETDRSPVQFMAIGDTNPVLGHTTGVVRYGLERHPEFVVHMGDLQYYSSILETWQVWMGLMQPLLREGGDFQPCIGNHENELNGQEFANYYARYWDQPGFDGQLQWYSFATGGVHFFSLSTEENFAEGSAQLAWLDSAMAAAEATPGYRFSILYFHRPLYTVGDAAPEVGLRSSLGARIIAHHIPLVLAGHMHGYERFIVGPVTYVTTAGGGGVIGNVNAGVATYPMDAAMRVASGPYFHAMAITLTDGNIHGEAVDETGIVRDSFDISVPR